MPQIIDVLTQRSLEDWETSVKDSVCDGKSTLTLTPSGYHTRKFSVDPGLVLEKLVVNLGGVKPSISVRPRATVPADRKFLGTHCCLR